MNNATTAFAGQLIQSFKTQAASQEYLEADDKAHFAQTRVRDAGIRQRILMERHIIRHFVKSLLARDGAPYTISIYDGEEWPVTGSRDVAAIMADIGACDEEWLVVRQKTPEANRNVGKLYLVYGNDGWDVIADCSATDELDMLLKETTELADAFGEVV